MLSQLRRRAMALVQEMRGCASALLAAFENQVFFGPLAPRLKEEVEHGS